MADTVDTIVTELKTEGIRKFIRDFEDSEQAIKDIVKVSNLADRATESLAKEFTQLNDRIEKGTLTAAESFSATRTLAKGYRNLSIAMSDVGAEIRDVDDTTKEYVRQQRLERTQTLKLTKAQEALELAYTDTGEEIVDIKQDTKEYIRQQQLSRNESLRLTKAYEEVDFILSDTGQTLNEVKQDTKEYVRQQNLGRTQTNKLTKAHEDYAFALTDTGKELTDVKQSTKEVVRQDKLSVEQSLRLTKAKEELAFALSDQGAELRQLKTELREVTAAEKKAAKAVENLESDVEDTTDTVNFFGATLRKVAKGGLKVFLSGVGMMHNKMKSVSSFVSGTLQHAFGNILSNVLQEVWQGVVRLSGAFLQFVGDSIAGAVEFESALVVLSNVASTQNLDMLRDVALMLGKDIKLVAVSAESAAEGLTELYKAGLDDITIFGEGGLSSVMSGASREVGAFKSVSDLAATSNLDFTQSAGLATTALAIYAGGILDSAEKAVWLTEAFDYMVLSANSSRAEVSDFSDALKGVGPTANELDIPINRVIDTLAILADNGIKGATAGTQLRQMLSNMTRETKKVTGALSALNIELWDENGNFKDLQVIVEDFNTAFYETGTSMAFVSNATAEQNDLFDSAIKQYDTAATKLYEYGEGLTDLSSDEVDELTAAQARAAAVMDEYNTIGGEYVEVQRKLTDREINAALLDIFGSRGRNTAAALFSDTTDAMEDQILTTEGMILANKLLEGGVDQLGSAYEELHKKQLEAVALEDQVNKIIESTAGKKEILDSILETYQQGFGTMFVELLGNLYESLTPLVENLLPEAMDKFEEWGAVLLGIGTEMLPVLVEWLGEKVIPALFDLGDWLLNDGLDAAIRFGGWIQEHIIDNLVTLYDWVTTDGSAMWESFKTTLGTLEEPIQNFAGWIKDPVLLVLELWWDFLVEDLVPILKELADIVLINVHDRLVDYGVASDGAVISTGGFIEELNLLLESAPPWLDFLLSISGLIFDFQVAIQTLKTEALDVFIGWFIDSEETTGTFIDETLPNITAGIKAISDAIRIDGLIAAFTVVMDTISAMLLDTFPVFIENLAKIFQAIFGIDEEIVLVVPNWAKIFEQTKDTIVNNVIDPLITKFNELKGWITEILTLLSGGGFTFPSISMPQTTGGIPGSSRTNTTAEDAATNTSGYQGPDDPYFAPPAAPTNSTSRYSPPAGSGNTRGASTVNNYYEQSNTVNATTTTTPEKLASILATMDERNI